MLSRPYRKTRGFGYFSKLKMRHTKKKYSLITLYSFFEYSAFESHVLGSNISGLHSKNNLLLYGIVHIRFKIRMGRHMSCSISLICQRGMSIIFKAIIYIMSNQFELICDRWISINQDVWKRDENYNYSFSKIYLLSKSCYTWDVSTFIGFFNTQ